MNHRCTFTLVSLLAAAVLSQVASGKRTEPDPAAQKEAEKKIKELFRHEYAAKRPEERKAFAVKLLATATETRDDPVASFVLFREARDLSADLGDARSALAAVDGIAERFAVDSLAMKAEALAASGKKAQAQADQEALIAECLQCLDDAVRGYDFKNARALLGVAKAAVRKSQNVWLTFNADVREKRLDRLFRWEKEVTRAFDRWNEAPEDPEANQVLGELLCLGQGDWKTGLAYLARGSKAALKDLAKEELRGPRSSEEQAALGASWWELSSTASRPDFKESSQERAFSWYERSLPGLSGIAKTAVEKRLEERPRCYLSMMQELDPRVGHGEFGKSGSMGPSEGSGKIAVNGLRSPFGLYMHGTPQGYSSVGYRLGGRYKKLEAFVALNDSADRPWSASTFIVEGDGKVLWKSKPIADRGKPQRCTVNIAGVDLLNLLVHCPGHHHMSHAVWLEPVVER